MSAFDRTRAPEPAAVREYRFPRVERSVLGNQLTVLSTRHSDLPITTLMIVTHAGGEHDLQSKAGLAELTARVLEAGTRSLAADRLAWEFELLGGELQAAVVWDCAFLSVTVPSDKIEPALALLAEIATAPALADSEIDRVKREMLSEIAQRGAEPRTLANDMAARFMFSPDVPYARPLVGTAASVKHLDTEDVRGFHQQHWGAGNGALIAVGSVDHGEIARLAGRHLGDWGTRAAAPAEFDVTSPVERTQIFLVDRPGSVQSELRVGHIGLARTTPDYFAATVASGVLGGVFTSRLNLSLREKHGFTYGVRSGFAFRKQPGPFVIQTAVASDVTARALHELLTETRTLIEDGVTEEEVVATRDYLAGVMPLEMQTTHQKADRIADIFVYGLTDDYMPQHRAALLSVTREEANRAAREHIRTNEFAITIVGDAKAIENDLAALDVGPIEVHSTDE
jgi:zinc protease